jgi:hypothetical protein
LFYVLFRENEIGKKESFKLSSDAFAITPGGEVVIDHEELVKALENAVKSVEVVVDSAIPTDTA